MTHSKLGKPGHVIYLQADDELVMQRVVRVIFLRPIIQLLFCVAAYLTSVFARAGAMPS